MSNLVVDPTDIKVGMDENLDSQENATLKIFVINGVVSMLNGQQMSKEEQKKAALYLRKTYFFGNS